jgi:hypothetical protein
VRGARDVDRTGRPREEPGVPPLGEADGARTRYRLRIPGGDRPRAGRRVGRGGIRIPDPGARRRCRGRDDARDDVPRVRRHGPLGLGPDRGARRGGGGGGARARRDRWRNPWPRPRAPRPARGRNS